MTHQDADYERGTFGSAHLQTRRAVPLERDPHASTHVNAEYVRYTDTSVGPLVMAVDVFLDQAERHPHRDAFVVSGYVYTQLLAAFSRLKVEE